MDKFEELRKYKELLDEGVITQDEFERKKEELLGEATSKTSNNSGILNSSIDDLKASKNKALDKVHLSVKRSNTNNKKVLLIICCMVILVIGVVIVVRSLSNEPIVGSWHCVQIDYDMGVTDTDPNNLSDKTLKITNNKVIMNIVSEIKGTWVYDGDITADDASVIKSYTITTDEEYPREYQLYYGQKNDIVFIDIGYGYYSFIRD